MDTSLIGREREQAELRQAYEDAGHGRGHFLLLTGEAGVGKTRLAQESLARSDLLVLAGAGEQSLTLPYGPITGVLRAYLRVVPNGLDDCGPLAPHLAFLLPEIGSPPAGANRSSIFEAVRCAFELIASRAPTAVFLDDLHWADSTTLELLPVLAASLERAPLLLLGSYRSDEIPRGHPLRRMRTELRRASRLRELEIGPLNKEETTVLARHILGGQIDLQLAATLYDRTQGVAFFVEELAAALAARGRLRHNTARVTLTAGEDVPVPDTVRDAVLLRVDGLSEGARQALEAAAVADSPFDLDLVAETVDADGALNEAIESGLLIELDGGRASFRHVLAREAVYADIPWPRKRALHRRIAERLEMRGAPPGRIARHWVSAREDEPARLALLASAEANASVHACRDALDAGRQALELWPDGRDEPHRLILLTRLGEWAELCGDLSEAIHVWREAAEGYRLAGNMALAAGVERRLAGAHELQANWESAMETRQAAAEAFASAGMTGDAAAERLMAATHLRSAASFHAALALLDTAGPEAKHAGRVDLQARTLALRGNVLTRMGRAEEGLTEVRAGLALALEHNVTVAATEIYQRLADSLEHAGDYAAAQAA